MTSLNEVNFHHSGGLLVDYTQENPGCDGCNGSDWEYDDPEDDYYDYENDCTCGKIVNPHIKDGSIKPWLLAQQARYSLRLADPLMQYLLERTFTKRPPTFNIKVEKEYSGEGIKGVYLKPQSRRIIEEMLTHDPAQFLRRILKEEHTNLTLGDATPTVQKKVLLAAIMLPDKERVEEAEVSFKYSLDSIRELAKTTPVAVCVQNYSTYTVIDGYCRVVAVKRTRKKHTDIVVVDALLGPMKPPPFRGRRLLL